MGNVNMGGMRMGTQGGRGASTTTTTTTTTTNNNPSSREPKSTGYNPTNEWDDRTVRKLVNEGKLAPRVSGSDRSSDCKSGQNDCVECPICFMFFDAFNLSTCCHQPICTECYLQIRPERESVACPFCSADRFSAVVARGKRFHDGDDASAEAKREEAESKAESAGARRPARRDCFEEVDGESKEGEAQAKPKPNETRPRVLSVRERDQVEAEMRKQLELARERGDSISSADDQDLVPTASSTARRVATTSRYGTARPRGGGRQEDLDDFHSFLGSLGTSSVGVDLEHVEELMILEAMRASLEDDNNGQNDSSRRERSASDATGAAPLAAATADDDDDDDDDNNEEFRAAMAASMLEAQPPPVPAPAPAPDGAEAPSTAAEAPAGTIQAAAPEARPPL